MIIRFRTDDPNAACAVTMFTNFLTMLDAPMRLTQVSRLDAELFMKLYKLPPGLLTPADRDFCLDIVKRIWAGFFTRPVQNVKIDLVQSGANPDDPQVQKAVSRLKMGIADWAGGKETVSAHMVVNGYESIQSRIDNATRADIEANPQDWAVLRIQED